jgi:hypothetical protein
MSASQAGSCCRQIKKWFRLATYAHTFRHKGENRFDRRVIATRSTGGVGAVAEESTVACGSDEMQTSQPVARPYAIPAEPWPFAHRLLTYMIVCLSAACSRYVLIQEHCSVDRALTAPRQGPRLC